MREIVRVLEDIGSLTLVMGNMVRFHIREMFAQVAEMTQKFGGRVAAGWRRKYFMKLRFGLGI